MTMPHWGKRKEPDKLVVRIVPTADEQRIRAARLAMFGVMLKDALDG